MKISNHSLEESEETISELLDWLCHEEDNQKQGLREKIMVTEETIEDFLFGDISMQLLAVQFLRKSNLRNYLDLLHTYFASNSQNPMIKADLIEMCIDQQIMEEFKLVSNGLEMYFIPHYLEMPMDQDGVNEALSYLSDWFLTKEPNFYQMCKEVLLQEAYLQLPLMWELGDGFEVALSIAKYVFKAWNRMDEFEQLLEKEGVKEIKLLDLMVETIEFE